MAYYSGVGDYYRGDYYRGDPGFGKLLAKGLGLVKKHVVPTAARLLFGTKPLTKGRQIITRPAGRIATAIATYESGRAAVKGVRSVISRQPAVVPINPLTGGRIGAPMMSAQEAQEMGFRRPSRRMNVANVRALRRALRRVSGFGKLASRTRRDVARAATAIGVRRTAPRKRFGRK